MSEWQSIETAPQNVWLLFGANSWTRPIVGRREHIEEGEVIWSDEMDPRLIYDFTDPNFVEDPATHWSYPPTLPESP